MSILAPKYHPVDGPLGIAACDGPGCPLCAEEIEPVIEAAPEPVLKEFKPVFSFVFPKKKS